MLNLMGYTSFTNYVVVNANNDEPLQRFGSESQAIEFTAKLNKKYSKEVAYIIAETHTIKTNKITA